MSLSEAQLSAIVPTLKGDKLKSTLTALNAAIDECGNMEPVNVAMFIAQVAHESMGFFYTKEIASGAAYEGRKDLGNVVKGDGVKFKGRGWVQITGRANYKQISEYYGVDFIAKPELLETLEWCGKSAVWFWNSRNLNTVSNPGTEDAFKAVTKKINGGYNGYDDRKKYWDRAKKALGI